MPRIGACPARASRRRTPRTCRWSPRFPCRCRSWSFPSMVRTVPPSVGRPVLRTHDGGAPGPEPACGRRCARRVDGMGIRRPVVYTTGRWLPVPDARILAKRRAGWHAGMRPTSCPRSGLRGTPVVPVRSVFVRFPGGGGASGPRGKASSSRFSHGFGCPFRNPSRFGLTF